MKIINKQKRSIVYYDESNQEFIKNFNPKFSNKLKFFLRFRKYPGDNFNFISRELNKLGIFTVKVLKYTHYSVTTKKLDGISLDNYLKLYPNSNILNDFIILITKLLNNNLYCGDLSYDNFFVVNNQIYAIDLEDYRKVKFFKRDNKEALRRMKGKVDDWVIEEVKKRLK